MKHHSVIVLLAIIFFTFFPSNGKTDKKKILIINSYHGSYPWSSNSLEGLTEHLNPEYERIVFEMDTKRIPSNEFESKAAQCMDLLHRENPDLVVTMDDNALKYLGQQIRSLKIPIVFMGINQNPRLYFDNKILPHNVTGVLERPLLKRSLSVLSKIYGPSRFLLMMDDGITSDAIIETSLFGNSKIRYASCEIDLFTTNSFAEWKKRVLSLNTRKYTGIIICNYAAMRNEQGKQAPMNSVSTWTSANSKVPVFALWRYSLGKGKAVGGLVMSGYYQGKAAAEMANSILMTGNIPSVQIPTQGVLIYSRHELSRWRIKLPHEIRSKAKFVE